ncbi:MAG TPA: ATPase domain-containing protein, partial [Acidobacteriaceae bacterium]
PSGIAELDALFYGGIQRGTATLLAGPTGSGKSTLCSKWAYSAALRGERAAIFTFDETRRSFLDRSRGLGMDIQPHIASQMIHLEQLDPAELSPGEFVERICRGVEEKDWRLVVIDSLNGLMNSMSEERALIMQLHELLSYLNQLGVATFLVLAQFGLLGQAMTSPTDVSYLADNVLLLRYFEARGEVRQAISVVKRRSGPHERSIREMQIKDGKISIGDPLKDFVGVLTGNPEYTGGQDLL